MAERRMFARSVMVVGQFPELSHGAQALYIALNMLADDDGFIGNAKVLMRQCRCTAKHLQQLLDEGFLLQFPNGVVVIAHWLIHNQLRRDRYKPTLYQEECRQLFRGKNKPYRFLSPSEIGCQNAAIPATQESGAERSQANVSKAKQKEDELTPGNQDLAPEVCQSSLTDYEKNILKFYIKHCRGMQENLYLDRKLRIKIRVLEENGWSLKALEKAFRMAGESSFLCGENEDGWVCSLDWLCDNENLQKVRAGRYIPFRKKNRPDYGISGELGDAEREEIARLLREE